MKLTTIKSKKEWDSWFLLSKFSEFLQFWDWGEFQLKTGKEVLRIRLEDGKKVGQMQGFIHRLGPGFKYIYFPRVVLPNDLDEPVLLKFLKKQGIFFVRFEPIENGNNFSVPDKNRQPKQTLILDLKETEENLLQSMHSKTRYNIRLAEKKGIEIKTEKNIDAFWNLNKETTDRDDFKSHDKNYYDEKLKMQNCFQLTAYFEDKPVAANIFVKFGNAFTYLHGASSNEFRNLMAPYLLQWEAIKMAKKLGCNYYDFWGVSPLVEEEKETADLICFNGVCWQKKHPWSGVTRFKVGFGGKYKEYPQAFELPIGKIRYFVYRVVKKIRNKE